MKKTEIKYRDIDHHQTDGQYNTRILVWPSTLFNTIVCIPSLFAPSDIDGATRPYYHEEIPSKLALVNKRDSYHDLKHDDPIKYHECISFIDDCSTIGVCADTCTEKTLKLGKYTPQTLGRGFNSKQSKRIADPNLS